MIHGRGLFFGADAARAPYFCRPGEAGIQSLALPFKGRVGWGWCSCACAHAFLNYFIPAKAGIQFFSPPLQGEGWVGMVLLIALISSFRRKPESICFCF